MELEVPHCPRLAAVANPPVLDPSNVYQVIGANDALNAVHVVPVTVHVLLVVLGLALAAFDGLAKENAHSLTFTNRLRLASMVVGFSGAQ